MVLSPGASSTSHPGDHDSKVTWEGTAGKWPFAPSVGTEPSCSPGNTSFVRRASQQGVRTSPCDVICKPLDVVLSREVARPPPLHVSRGHCNLHVPARGRPCPQRSTDSVSFAPPGQPQFTDTEAQSQGPCPEGPGLGGQSQGQNAKPLHALSAQVCGPSPGPARPRHGY